MSTIISPEVIATTLKHLNVRRHNFYHSIEQNPGDPQRSHWNREVEYLNAAISFYESVRESSRLSAPDDEETS